MRIRVLQALHTNAYVEMHNGQVAMGLQRLSLLQPLWEREMKRARDLPLIERVEQLVAHAVVLEMRAQNVREARLKKQIKELKKRLDLAEDIALDDEDVYQCRICRSLTRVIEGSDQGGMRCSQCSDAFCKRCALEYLRTCPKHGHVHCATGCGCEDC